MNLIPSTTDDTLAAIQARQVIDRIAFSASSIRGAKSEALQFGIPPQRHHDFAYCAGGQWTLVYEAKP